MRKIGIVPFIIYLIYTLGGGGMAIYNYIAIQKHNAEGGGLEGLGLAILMIVGIIFGAVAPYWIWVAYAGIACFSLCAVFQLVTLPTEFNASSRALSAIRTQRLLDDAELKQTKEVLSAAAMTYVAALAVTLMQLLRLFLIVSRSDRRR